MTFLTCFSTALEEPREPPIQSDWQALSYICSKYYMWDKKLFSTKWFDYRQMTPLQATAKYMSDYEKVYRRIYAENINYEVAKNIKFSSIASISKKNDIYE